MGEERVFLTGGTGFIGSHIVPRLRALGHEVLLYDSFTTFAPPFQVDYAANLAHRFPDTESGVRIVRGEVRHRGFLQRTLDEFQPTRVIHLAALSDANLSNRFTEEAIENNLLATTTLLEALQTVPSNRRFVYTSSSMVYGDFQYTPADEEHPKAPKELYGATKLAGEVMVEAYGRRYGMPYTILRPSAVYGPTDLNRRVTQIFIENALRKRPLTLDNGGQSKLDFTHVEDAAEGFVRATFTSQAANRTYNITRGRARSLRELADLVARCVPGTKIEEREVKVFRPERGTLCIDRAREELGFEPKIDLEDGIPTYVDFMRRMLEQVGALDKAE